MSSITPKRTRSPLTKSRQTPKSAHGDRFIPNRSAMEAGQFNMQDLSSVVDCDMVSQQDYSQALRANMFSEHNDGKILAYKNKAPASSGNHNPNRVVFSTAGASASSEMKKKRRAIPTAPTRILDAPDIADDYYLNVLDWGSENTLAIALAQTVYLWNATTGGIDTLVTCNDSTNYAASVKWMPDSSYLAVGMRSGVTDIYDPATLTKIRSMAGHQERVCSLSWNPTTPHLLSSGSLDSRIINHDVRIRDSATAVLAAHQLEVCGLEWSPDGAQLASGGNDNLLCIWNVNHYTDPAFRIAHHQAAVKALAWSPHRPNVLASGGGTADRRLCFWNSSTGACIKEVDTKSQVCAVRWSKNHRDELITSHGFSQNQLTIWNYPSLSKITELNGHTSRVLYMAESPDGETIVSGAGDETLRFWKVFSKPDASASRNAKVIGDAAPAFNNSMSRLR
jgi:cell division cycle 20, cofactor of APC complex